MRLIQLFACELSAGCNLAAAHPLCPVNDRRRWQQVDTRRRLDDDTIVQIARRAYGHLGFTGLMGFHLYNEPLLSKDRMLALMMRIRAAVPASRFILYTNGTLIRPPAAELAVFEEIRITNYTGRDFSFLEPLVPRLVVTRPDFDNRRDPPASIGSAPCLRPFVELAVDAYGNVHTCSIDWQGDTRIGNVFTEDFALLVARFAVIRASLCGRKMAPDAPPRCLSCTNRYSRIATYDARIARRARRWVALARLCSPLGRWLQPIAG